jgi:hypothetical protein
VEERRLEARRVRRNGYEQEFRLTHAKECHDVTETELKQHAVTMKKSHDSLHNAREQKKEAERELDRQFAINQHLVAQQQAAYEDAVAAQKKADAYRAGLMNKQISEAKKAEAKANSRKESETDNAMIQANLAAKRTFLF